MLGATPVTISGVGFKPGATVQFGGVPAVAIVVSSTTITATAPAHADGIVTVVVTNPGGQSASRAPGYTYEVEPAFAISGVVTEMTDEGEMPVEGVRIDGERHAHLRADGRQRRVSAWRSPPIDLQPLDERTRLRERHEVGHGDLRHATRSSRGANSELRVVGNGLRNHAGRARAARGCRPVLRWRVAVRSGTRS